MKESDTLLYNVHSPEALYNTKQIEYLVQELMQRGYFLVAKEEEDAVELAWMLYLHPDWSRGNAADRAEKQVVAAPYQERSFTPGITEQLRQEVEQFKAHQRENLHVYVKVVTRTSSLLRHEFDFNLGPKVNCLALNYSNDLFIQEKDAKTCIEAFDHWLEIIEMFYNFCHPIYAYSWNHDGSIPLTDEEYLGQRRPYRLYEINFFGPEMVEHLGGREYLLKTPAEFARPLSDGGVLIIPELAWYPSSPPYPTWSKVAKYLGVVRPDFAVDDDDDE